MNYLDEALAAHGPNRSQERREKTAGGTSINIIPCQGKKGFCETCRRHKPAPKRRLKGWVCRECKVT